MKYLLIILLITSIGCKSYYKQRADAAMWRAYSVPNDTVIAKVMARELARFDKERIGTTFQVIAIEHKEGFNVVTFQYSYDGNFLGGSIELYLHSDSVVRFKIGRGYFVDFTPESGGEPMGAPDQP